MKKKYDELVIEVTRKCNMNCEHCLRGCAENENISNETIDQLLDGTEYINSLTFTGGEPLLNLESMHYIIDGIINRGIELSSFYLVTNGTVFDKDLFFKLIELYWYCEDNSEEGMCGISCSIDQYHENEHTQDIINKWKSLSFYRDYKEIDDYGQGLISEGNASDNGIGYRMLNIDDEKVQGQISYRMDVSEDEMSLIDISGNIYEIGNCPLTEVSYVDIDGNIDHSSSLDLEGMTYVNVFGEVLNNCDMSYETQSENVLGTVKADDYFEIMEG